jgi:ferritin-like metal-binding protein YciE
MAWPAFNRSERIGACASRASCARIDSVSVSPNRNTHMTQERTDRLREWLEDAYAMEQEAETMLKSMAGRIEHYPDLQARLEQHVAETQQQMAELEGCIEELGGSRPRVKAAAGSLMASVQAMGNAMMSDEVAKGVGISYAFEQMEIVTYRAVVIAARRAGQESIAQRCEAIMAQEEAMANWLFDAQPQIIAAFLDREAADMDAKR